MLYGRHTLPLWAVLVQSVLPAFNALYYNKQAAYPYPYSYPYSYPKP